MAKKKKEEWSLSDTDALFDAQLKVGEERFGAGFHTGKEAEERIVGLPLMFAPSYLFQSTVLPLGRMTMIVGAPGSLKTSLLYEMFRWHRAYKGRNVLFEVESKMSPDLMNSILNYDYNAVAVQSCQSLDECIRNLSNAISRIKAGLIGVKGAPGPGKAIPVGIGIDSLTAKMSEESATRFASDGPGRAFPAEAQFLTQTMRAIPGLIDDWPWSLLCVNHEKKAINASVPHQKIIPGGIGLEFQSTFIIEMAFMKDIKTADLKGVRVLMRMKKNSLGQSRGRLEAEMLWGMDYDSPEGAVQRTFWNWYAASIDLLISFNKDGTKSLWNRINEIVDINRPKANRVWSTVLGIPKDDPVTFHEAGRLLEQREDILQQLRPLLGIKTRKPFVEGLDYRSQLLDVVGMKSTDTTDEEKVTSEEASSSVESLVEQG